MDPTVQHGATAVVVGSVGGVVRRDAMALKWCDVAARHGGAVDWRRGAADPSDWVVHWLRCGWIQWHDGGTGRGINCGWLRECSRRGHMGWARLGVAFAFWKNCNKDSCWSYVFGPKIPKNS